VPPGRPESAAFGAFHSSEIAFVFNNLGKWHRPWQSVDRQMAETISNYWVNFAKTGDPNGAGLPPWPSFDPSNEQSMHFADTAAAIPTPQKPELDFFGAWYASQ
jgi:para-nitrobenzyl esterase